MFSKGILVLLMFIGASPGSTGGGIKTGTFFALLQGLKSAATNKSETFEINGYKKYCLMNALDDIDFLLENKDKLETMAQLLLQKQTIYKERNEEKRKLYLKKTADNFYY